MGRRPTTSVDAKNGKSEATNGCTDGNVDGGEVHQLKSLPKNRIVVVREPVFPPDLNTKGFKFQRQAKISGGAV